jgi:ABC-type transport system involved in multi-copper enzyme maturation permease subunit
MILASQQIETWFTPYSAVNNVMRVLTLLDRDLLVGDNALMAVSVTASLLIVVAYIVGFSALSIYLFKRRDM